MSSIDGFGSLVGRGGAHAVYEDEGEFLFVGEVGVDEGLDVVAAGRGELDVEEEADVVGDAGGGDLEGGGLGEDDRLPAVVGQDAHLGEVAPLAAPLCDDGELHHRHGEV